MFSEKKNWKGKKVSFEMVQSAESKFHIPKIQNHFFNEKIRFRKQPGK